MFPSLRSICALSLLLTLSTFAMAQASLKPFQRDALEKVLASMDPQMQQMMRPQLEQTFSMLDESQVRMMLESMAADQSGMSTDEEAYFEEEMPVASEEDLEFNRRQYEPAIRQSWQAAKTFDDFVDAELAMNCPPANNFAVYGSGWRYEIYPPNISWPRASNSADLDIQIIGASYAPQDGRYSFDFSEVKDSFDQARVHAAIAGFCRDYQATGESFMREAKRGIKDDFLPGGYELEQKYNGMMRPHVQQLESVVQSEAPSANNAVFMALLNGQRID